MAYGSIRAGLLSALADTAARSGRPLTAAVIELLQSDTGFADEYLHAAREQANQEGGREALQSALRLVAKANDSGSGN